MDRIDGIFDDLHDGMVAMLLAGSSKAQLAAARKKTVQLVCYLSFGRFAGHHGEMSYE
jgi:hypothetical protein